MNYSQEREQFIATMTQEGLPITTIRTILARANTLQRNAELSCSSEAADRDRVQCPGVRKEELCCCDGNFEHSLTEDGQRCKYCGISAATKTSDVICHQDIPRIDRQTARIERELTALLAKYKIREDGPCFTPHFGGDPRGAVLVISVPSGKYDSWERNGICVPSKGLPASLRNVDYEIGFLAVMHKPEA
jgi:hypothetical protein